MPAFAFDVRRPLPSKEGPLVEKLPDGTHRDVQLRLAWPRLEISGAGGEASSQDLIENCVVKARPDLDGNKGFALECAHRNGSRSVTFLAARRDERDEWCKVLRKHAVHYCLENGFDMTKKVLGTGSYASVYLAKDKLTNEFVALKIIPRERLNPEERLLLAEEAWISQEVNSEYCVTTKEFIENETSYVLVMEYVPGGELYERLLHHKYPEREVQSIMRQVLSGVAYMHSRNIAHFDLKPENLLLSVDRPMTVKIADFGVAMDMSRKAKNKLQACFKSEGMLRCSPGYGAPEIVSMKDGCGKAADMWSMGVCLYLLLTLRQPFVGATPNDTRRMMMSGRYDSAPLSQCSTLAADLVARLLELNPDARMSALDALNHPWIRIELADTETKEVEEEVSTGCCGLCKRGHDPKLFKDPSLSRLRREQIENAHWVDSTAHSVYRGNADPSVRGTSNASLGSFMSTLARNTSRNSLDTMVRNASRDSLDNKMSTLVRNHSHQSLVRSNSGMQAADWDGLLASPREGENLLSRTDLDMSVRLGQATVDEDGEGFADEDFAIDIPVKTRPPGLLGI